MFGPKKVTSESLTHKKKKKKSQFKTFYLKYET